jgi:GT2 family glycosyltransferase
MFPQVKVIARKVGRGYSSYNLGFKVARGKYFVILDSDTEINKDLCTQVVRKFKENEDVGIIAFKVLDYDSGRESSQKAPRKKRGSRQHGYEALTFNGCGWAMRREVYEALGGVIEEYFLYCNEYEYGVRALEAGFDIRYFPDLVVYHKEGKSKERSSGKAGFYQARNWTWFLLEFVPLSSVIQLLSFLRKTSHRRGREDPKIFGNYLVGLVVGFLTGWRFLLKRRRVKLETKKRIEGGILGKHGYIFPW